MNMRLNTKVYVSKSEVPTEVIKILEVQKVSYGKEFSNNYIDCYPQGLENDESDILRYYRLLDQRYAVERIR